MFVSLFVFKQPILGYYYKYSGLPKWLSGKKKNLPANAGDIGDVSSIPGSGRYPGGGNGKPLQ